MIRSCGPAPGGMARNALFGAIGGMIIVGVAFMVPRLISETVIEPSGGASLGSTSTVSCDEIFKNQLVRQQAAGNANRMSQVKVQVQQRQNECAAEVWDPLIITGTLARGVRSGWGSTYYGLPAYLDCCFQYGRCACNCGTRCRSW